MIDIQKEALEFMEINKEMVAKSLLINADFHESLVDGLFVAYHDFISGRGYNGLDVIKVRKEINRIYSQIKGKGVA